MAVVTQLQFRRGTAAQWTSVNPVLAAGEFGYETDTGKAKIGNGITAWSSLSYALTGAVGTITSIIAGSGLTGGTITSSGTIAVDTSIVATLTGTQTLTNKTISVDNNTISGIANSSFVISNSSGNIDGAAAQVAIPTGTVVGTSDTQTLTNKTINGTNNTITNVSLTTGVTGTLPAANGGTGITSLGSGVATFLGTPSSANLASAVTDETGSGALVFGTSPTISAGTFSDAVIRQALNTPTFTTNAYTLALTDQGDILLASNGATAGTITIPLNSSVAFPTGTQITIIQTGSGQITVQGAGGVTVASTGATSTAPKLRVQNSSATCIKTGTDTWYVVGDIS